MTTKKNVFLLVLSLLLCVTAGYADDAFSIKMIKLADLRSKFGTSPLNTYEDVEDITDIKPYVTGVGPIIWPGYLESRYNKVIKEEEGRNLLEMINSFGGMVYHEKSFIGFLYENFYLDAGSYDKERIWHDSKVTSFPFTYKPGDKPHRRKYHLCIKGGWQYIPPVNFDPDAKSCDKNKAFCDYPPCVKEEKEDKNEDGDFDDPEDKNQGEEHHQPTNNVYTKLGSDIKGCVVTATGAETDTSGEKYEMNFADRTPPLIDGCVDGKFPELGKNKPATTGDWYKVEGLKITDNYSKKIGTCLVLGKIDKYPSGEWEKEENWFPEPPREIDSGSETDHVIMPNACHGVMRYSVFAWDKSGNVNPGEPYLKENDPENCYGLRNWPEPNLGRDPKTAKPWPIVASLTDNILTSIDMTTIDPGERRGEGMVHIRDNDLPNIVIRIESVKDGRTVFFPPVVKPGSLPIYNSTEFEKSAADPEGNAKAYRDFVGATPDPKFDTAKLADPDLGLPLYFDIFDVKPRATLPGDPGMTAGEIAKLEEFKDPAKHEFIRKNFRLEDYNQSDNKVDGSPDTDPETYGARNGIGGEVMALLSLPGGGLQEDVEYKISVWADDNVKWATMEAGKVLDKVIAIPTGIFAGEILVEVPNQHPAATYKKPLDKDKAVTEPLIVVFREPTQPLAGKPSENSLKNARYPFIEVKATDFAGLTRKIRLYVTVSDDNPEIRVLERSHEKNN